MLPANEGQSFDAIELDPAKQTHSSLGERNRLWGIWNDRISLISQCATAYEAVSLLASEIQSNTTLLKDATFRASAWINGNDSASNPNDHAVNRTISRLTREQNALVVRLEAEKARYLNLRAQLVKGKITEKGAEEETLKGVVEEQGQGSQAPDDKKAGEKLDAGAPDQQRGQQEQHDSDCEQSGMMVLRLSDKITTIKSVLAEMRQMASSRAAQDRTSLGSTPPASSKKRKHGTDLVTDSNQGQSFIGPSSLRVSSRISKQDALALRVELERCMHQVTEININADQVDVITDLLEVAQDELRAERAQSAQEYHEAEEEAQAEFDAEVAEELALVAQQTGDLDIQVGEVTGAVTGLVLHVDDLEETVELEGRCKVEMRSRVEQMKENMKSYAALRTESAAAISALGATLDNYSQQHIPSAPVTTPELTSLHPVYPPLQNLRATLLSTVSDDVINTARPLLDCTRSELAKIVRRTNTSNFQALEVQVAKTLNAFRESVEGLSRTFASPLAMPLPTPMFRAQSVDSLRYTPPPGETDPILSSINIDTPDGITCDTSPPPSPTTGESAFDVPPANTDSSPNTNITTPEVQPLSALNQSPSAGTLEGHIANLEKTTTPQQLDCSFLANPLMQGISVRLHPVDFKNRICRPFAFIRMLPARAAACRENYDDGDAMALTRIVEVRDCRKGYHNGKFFQFPLDAVCYLPPTVAHQVVVCVTPDVGVDPPQKYIILHFDAPERGQCLLRKHPKPKGPNRKEDLISLPTHLLAQVGRPVLPLDLPASLPAAADSNQAGDVPAAPANASSGSEKKLTIKIKPRVQAPASTLKPKVHFDHPPPMWLTDPVFSGCRVQLKEQDGDGSIFELLTVDTPALTVEVQPLLSSAPCRRSVPLEAVRHIVACAPYQTVVVTAGELKGEIMKVGKYSKDECTLYMGRRQTWAKDRERTYKTAHLAVILPPRK